MPYYIGDVIKDAKRLIARTPEKFRETGVDVRLNVSVEKVDDSNKLVHFSDGSSLPYDILVFGTGSSTFVPKIEGLELEGVFVLKKLSDAVRMKNFIRDKKVKSVIIVGGGFIGMEMTENLRNLGIETTVIDLVSRPALRWDSEFSKMILEEINSKGVVFHGNTEMKSIERGTRANLRLNTNNGAMEADMILIAIGVRPNVKLAADMGLQIGRTGAIQVDFSQRTSKEHIYAVGDCCESFHLVSKKWVHIPLGDIANKQGRVAGINIAGGNIMFQGIVGAQSFKIFDMEAAATGLDEKEAANSGYHPISTIIWGNAIARALGEKRVGLKLVADRSTGKLLGAQAVGLKGAVERINILSSALWAGFNLGDLAYLDLAYAPPFSPAWDPIHIAAQELMRKI